MDRSAPNQPSAKPDAGYRTIVRGLLLLIVAAAWGSFRAGRAGQSGFEPAWYVELLFEFIRDLGVAYIVAGIVSLGVERIARERFSQEVKEEIHKIERNVINASYQKRYPRSYTDTLGLILENGSLFRTDLCVDISLLPADSGGGLVFDQAVSYRMMNISNEDQTFRPKIFLDKTWVEGLMYEPEVVSWVIAGQALSAADIIKADSTVPDSQVQKWYQHSGKTLKPGESVHVTTRVKNRRHLRDATTWCSVYPCDGINFTVRHPPGFSVILQAKSHARSSDAPAVSEGDRVTLTIFNALLPYTTVEMAWDSIGAQKVPSHGDSLGEGLK